MRSIRKLKAAFRISRSARNRKLLNDVQAGLAAFRKSVRKCPGAGDRVVETPVPSPVPTSTPTVAATATPTPDPTPSVIIDPTPTPTPTRATVSYEMLRGGKYAGSNGMRAMTLGPGGNCPDPSNYPIEIDIRDGGVVDFTVTAKGIVSCYQGDGSELPELTISVNSSLQKYLLAKNVLNEYRLNGVALSPGQHTLNLTWGRGLCPAERVWCGQRDSVQSVTMTGPVTLSPKASVNFQREVKPITLANGFNVKDAVFWEHPQVQSYYRATNTDYARVWVQNVGRAFYPNPNNPNGSHYLWQPGLNTGEYANEPYRGPGQYDFTNLERDIRVVLLDMGAKPLIDMGPRQLCPGEMLVERTGACERSYFVPRDFNECASYYADIVEHFYDLCSGGGWDFCGDFKKWYWDFGNEPDGKFCDNRPSPWADFNNEGAETYINFFNTVYDTIKARVSDATVGGWESAGIMIDEIYPQIPKFLARTRADFISIHAYDSNSYYSGYLLPNWIRQKIRQYRGNQDIPILNSEYNFEMADGSNTVRPILYEPVTDPKIGDFGAMWEASTLAWQAKSELDGEFHFEGNSYPYASRAKAFCNDGPNHDESWTFIFCYGMWSASEYLGFPTTPMFDVRKLFTTLNPAGAMIVEDQSQDDLLQVFATKNAHRNLTVINKRAATVYPEIVLDGDAGSVVKITPNGYSQIESSGSRIQLSLLPYEVAFLRLDGGCPELWSCGAWQQNCVGGYRHRTCTDAHACGSVADKPPVLWRCDSDSPQR